jgi:hypothetical protein
MNAFNVCLKFVWQRSRTLALVGVALVAAGAAVAVGRPHVVSEAFLGNEWQCSRTVFLITTCVPVREQNSPPPNGAAWAGLIDSGAPAAMRVQRQPAER